MGKKEKLAQIADLTMILQRLMKEYNADISGYEAHIADINISTVNNFDNPEAEIHLHGSTDNLDIEFSLTGELQYENHIIRDFGSRFHGVNLTDCQFEWHIEPKEGEDNASVAV
jgi:hypothetical protein